MSLDSRVADGKRDQYTATERGDITVESRQHS